MLLFNDERAELVSARSGLHDHPDLAPFFLFDAVSCGDARGGGREAAGQASAHLGREHRRPRPRLLARQVGVKSRRGVELVVGRRTEDARARVF